MTVRPVAVYEEIGKGGAQGAAPPPVVSVRPGRIESGRRSHPLDVDLGRSPPDGRATAEVKRLYAAGAIATHAEFERRLERALLLDAPRDQPVPDGWEPLPPCDHDWLDITCLGSPLREQLCRHCGERVFTQ